MSLTYENVNSVSDNIYIFKDYINLQPYVGININYEREFTAVICRNDYVKPAYR